MNYKIRRLVFIIIAVFIVCFLILKMYKIKKFADGVKSDGHMRDSIRNLPQKNVISKDSLNY